jgi:hypothetical protein
MVLIIATLLIIVIAVSILIKINFGSNIYQIAQPSASSFQNTEWMQYIPINVTAFRFLNISALAISGFFNSSLLLDLKQLNMNVTPYDIRYGIEIYTSNGSFIHVMAVNESYANLIATTLANQSLLRREYNDIIIYHLTTHPINKEGGSWFCIDRGAIIFSGDKDTDLLGIMTIIDANVTSFFSSDSLKIEYLLTSNSQENIIFSYYAWNANSNNIDSEMRSATNYIQLLEVRTSYHFQTKQDFDNGYNDFITQILSSANSIYVSSPFLISLYYYQQDRLYSLFSSL